jgi:hypothetical protein
MGREKEAAMLRGTLQAPRQWVKGSDINGLTKKAAPEGRLFAVNSCRTGQILPGVLPA